MVWNISFKQENESKEEHKLKQVKDGDGIKDFKDQSMMFDCLEKKWRNFLKLH